MITPEINKHYKADIEGTEYTVKYLGEYREKHCESCTCTDRIYKNLHSYMIIEPNNVSAGLHGLELLQEINDKDSG